jgi:hypothetical protein
MKDISKIEMGGINLFEKKDPIQQSIILGMPVWLILAGVAIYKCFKK